MRAPLHPDHLADLRRSGLTDETIAALGIFSARPHDIPQLVGFDPPAIVTSVLVFKYLGEDFCRVKVFPPYRDKDGRLVKYLQRPGSGVHLYIPPRTASVLKNPTIPLTWCEGEKKSAKLDQEGIPCIGLGGLWNWLHEGRPIPKLDDIAHADREEDVCPDSDVWVRPDLLKPAYAFGKELEGRGARVKIVQCLPGADGQRQGPDDLIVAGDIQALHALKRLPLKHKAFQLPHKWWKGWSQREQNDAPPADAIKLIEGMEQTRLLHPAQEFVEGVLTFGVPVGDEVVLITSGRKIVNARELPKGVGLDNRGFDLCRFSKEGILEWQSGATRYGPELVAALEGFFRRFVVYRDNENKMMPRRRTR